jgi:hypothetical protein
VTDQAAHLMPVGKQRSRVEKFGNLQFGQKRSNMCKMPSKEGVVVVASNGTGGCP